MVKQPCFAVSVSCYIQRYECCCHERKQSKRNRHIVIREDCAVFLWLNLVCFSFIIISST